MCYVVYSIFLQINYIPVLYLVFFFFSLSLKTPEIYEIGENLQTFLYAFLSNIIIFTKHIILHFFSCNVKEERVRLNMVYQLEGLW